LLFLSKKININRACKETRRKAFLFLIAFTVFNLLVSAQSVETLIEVYTGDVSWNSLNKTVTFNTTGTMDFPNRELLYNNVWTIPEDVKHVVIGKNVTVTGEFYANYDCFIEGMDWETSVVYGTSQQNYLDQSRGFTAFSSADNKERDVTLTIKRLTSLNPKVYHITGTYRGKIHLDSCRVIDNRGGRWNNSDGFSGAKGSTVKNCYFETGEDVIKIYSDILVENTTIKMIEFTAPIQCGWGDYGSGITATFKNLKITGVEGRSPDYAIIEARQGNYTKNIIIDGLTVENPNASMFRLQQADATINVEVTNAEMSLKKYGDIVLAQGTRTICGTTEIKTEYNCTGNILRFNVTDLKSKIKNSGSVELRWKESNTDEKGYIIERAKASENLFVAIDTVDANATYFLDNTADEFVLYKYVVKAYFANEVLTPADTVLARTSKKELSNLPSPWNNIALGDTAVSLSSDAVFVNNSFVIDAGDGDFWNNACRGHFVYQPCRGNSQIIAKINDYAHVQSFSMAGVMIRESLEDTSKFAASLMISTPGPVMRDRVLTNGVVNQKPFANTAEKAPYWVKLERVGNLFTASTSANGLDWTKTREVTINMSNDAYIGMVATTHTETAIGNYSFSDVEVIGGVSNNISSSKIDNSFFVYPNPASKILFVDFKLKSPAELEIYAINGVKIKKQILENGINTINIDDINGGIYFVKVKGASGNVVKKVVVE
jgi:regulation of enolase protein 1 (concanavalin A-like superfamily)